MTVLHTDTLARKRSGIHPDHALKNLYPSGAGIDAYQLYSLIPSIFPSQLPPSPPLCALSQTVELCTQFYLSSFRFWLYIYSRPCWNCEGLSTVLGRTPPPTNNLSEIYSSRHLPGPRLLFDTTWFLGQLIRHALPPIRYVSRGGSWMLKEGYQGRGVSPV